MFEYKIIKSKDEGWFSAHFDWNKVQAELNKLGQLGWELINTIDVNSGHGRSKEVVFVLKRRINE